MFKNKSPSPFLWLLLIFITLFTLLSYTVAAAHSKEDVSAKAATLYQPDTGKFLYKKNSSKRLPMASTTKIMTALVVFENSSADEVCQIPREAVGVEGSSAYLKEGELFTVEELTYALLLQSANDAAVALAYHVGGDIESFSDLMNEKAAQLGLKNTHFKNPHGLDDADHYTSAEDLAIIATELLSKAHLKDIVSTYKKTFSSEQRQRTYVNHNKLLISCEGAIGVKTGFTKKSGRCLVGACEREGLRFVTVTLGAPDDWRDHKKLFDFGYNQLEKITLAEKGEFSYELPVTNGVSDTLSVKNNDCLSLILPKEDRDIKAHLALHRYVIAPINEGDKLGEIIFTDNGTELGRVELVAQFGVPSIKKKTILDKIKDKLF